MGKTYKAALYQGKGHIDIVEKQLPDQLGDDEVIVKNLIATICGADYASYARGDGDAHMLWSGYEFGHEMVSEVIAVGKDVKDVEVGDWLMPNLGYAYQDHHRMATVGGFSEYLVFPKFSLEGSCEVGSRKQPSAFKLDKSLGLENLCLIEPLSVGAKAASSLNPKGKTAVVIGAGVIGLSTAIMLKYYGAEKVMIIDFSEFRLANSRKYGILTCNPKNEDLDAGRFGHKGCRINSIAPGRIVTPMHQTLIDQEPERIAEEMRTMPLGRYGSAYEIGNLIDFLCSYQASYINGIDILMDDGTQAFTSTRQIPD